jgi:hypothetical protein
MIFKTPWHYLTWVPPALSAEGEIGIARLTRRTGMLNMVLLYWLFLTNEGRFTAKCAEMCFSQNYPIFLCAIGYFFDSDTLVVIGLAWLVTLAFGTAKYIGWIVSLLNRWPPLANG